MPAAEVAWLDDEAMEDRYVLAPVGEARRWVLHKPSDPYGDGYVLGGDVELVDEGLTVRGYTTVLGDGRLDLDGFVASLAADWRGWSGIRRWASLEDDMELDAVHESGGHVLLGVTLRQPRKRRAGRWSARVVFSVEAGEELSRLAEGISELIRD